MARLSLPISFLLLFLTSSLHAAGSLLFPVPMHLTRRIEDSVSGTSAVVEQYCYGNRVISIRGAVTSIADFEKGELTEINRETGTYSINRFGEVARASGSLPRSRATTSASGDDRQRWSLRSVGFRNQAGHEVEVFQGRIERGASAEIEVAVDRRIELSREAIEVLVGAAYPNQRSEESEWMLAAAAPDRSSLQKERGHALPIEQVITYQVDGERLEQRSTIVRIGDETVPAELISIPPGARLVESRLVKLQKELEELDRLPNPPR